MRTVPRSVFYRPSRSSPVRREVISRLVRLNRKLAWLLVAFTILLLVTGYGQSDDFIPRRYLRWLHIATEWIFISLLGYHLLVGFFLLPFRWRSMLERIRNGRARLASSLRLGLRLTCWPLAILSLVLILSGLSWFGIFSIPFNEHLKYDPIFLLIFLVHIFFGGFMAFRRARGSSKRRKEQETSPENGEGRDTRRKFISYLALIGTATLAAFVGLGSLLSGEDGKDKDPDPGDGHGFPNGSTMPSLEGNLKIEGQSYSFDPAQVETIRPDIFRPGYFSIMDILVHLDGQEEITLDYHYDQDLNSNIIDRIDGKPNWWYQIYYSGGWPERSAFRPDHYPWKDGTTLVFEREDPLRLESIYSTWREEVQRFHVNSEKVIVPRVMIRSREFRLDFKNVEVQAHNTRDDVFQTGVITALDVIMSLADQGKITYDLKWYESIGSAEIVKDYWVERIDSERAYDRCGYVYEAGDMKFRRFSGNHIHLPPGSRVLNSPEYVEFFWICL